jgi:hypothetical protein
MLRLLCTLCCLFFLKLTHLSPLQSTSSSVKTTEGVAVVVFAPAAVAFNAVVFALAAVVPVLGIAVGRDPLILIAAVAVGVVVKLPVPILIAGDDLLSYTWHTRCARTQTDRLTVSIQTEEHACTCRSSSLH